MILLNINSIKKLIIFALSAFILIFISSGLIANICENIADSADSYIIRSRMNEIASILKEKDISKLGDTNARLGVYNKSIDTIKSSPFIGMLSGKYKDNNIVAGGHSAFLDEIARLGIIFSIPFFITIYNILRNILKTIDNKKGKDVYFICIIIFTILGSINTTMFVPLIWLLFVVTPIICKNTLIKGGKEEKNESIMDS